MIPGRSIEVFPGRIPNEAAIENSDGNLTTTTERVFETYKNVTQDIRDQLNAEAEAVQIILTGIDNDIYSTVDACSNACEMWKAIERLKQGESINVQDLETNLYWEFGKFTSQDGESLESYYLRFYKMMNELIRNQCKVTNHRVNVQFLLQLQPEWQRFMTLVKQSHEVKTVSYHKLYDILKQHQHEVNEFCTEKLARVANPLALVAQQQPVHQWCRNVEFNATTAKNLDMLLGNIRNLNGQRMQLITGKRCYYSQELKTVSYHKLYDIQKQHQNEVNEIRAERITRVANPLALVAQQQPVYNPQNHHTHYTQNSSTRSQQATTRNRGKAIVNSPQPIYDQEPSMVAEDDETSKDKEIDKLMALISLLIGNVAGARETVGSIVVQKSGIQCYICKEFRNVARECQKLKRVKDAAYHREKMLLCKQEEAGIQLNADQADWRDDTDEELENQELEAHYMYMA
nr:hypothetical protein [Tanacetum cinerariifolium]